eukprot:TRINITY_DN42345_c0_g1_i1.p1 TRINITY_DN42345_c0_g1~~TRINITY_DN42345_c0_g1_i1.p1  ORF type:complete len:121 (+),score=28.81 TRINITY_DN42345_c0_g1_i1:329-691(+)
MARGEAIEVLGAADEGAEEGAAATLVHSVEQNRFIPSAHITLPTGQTLTMDADKAYDLFCELDAIQLKMDEPVSYTHLRAHETPEHLVCRLLLEKKKYYITRNNITITSIKHHIMIKHNR